MISTPGLGLFLLLSALCLHRTPVDGLNILMYVPTLSYSHVAFNGKIAEALIERGHQVVMLHIALDDGVSVYKESTAMKLRHDTGVPPGALLNTLWRNPGPFENSNPLNPLILRKFLRLSRLFLDSCIGVSKDDSIIESLANYTFDVVTVEQYDFCAFGLFKKLNVPSIVWLSATGLHAVQPNTLGIPQPNSYVPDLFGPFTDDMTLLERAQNTLLTRTTHFLFQVLSLRSINSIWRSKGVFQADRHVNEIPQSASAVIVNTVPSFDFSGPTLAHFHYIGGHTVEVTPPSLNEEWSLIAEKRPFVLLTFGSIAKTSEMPPHLQQAFFEGFKAFPEINFIVKYEKMNETIRMEADNVILTKWIPQISLIAHPNYKAIITHGGWSSILESLVHGKPMLLMPLFADHAKNSKVVEAKRVGLLVDKMDMDREEFVEKLGTILNDESYAERCRQFARHIAHHSPMDDVTTINYLVERAHREAQRKNARHCPINPVIALPPNGTSSTDCQCTPPPPSHRRTAFSRIPREAIISTSDLLYLPHFISALTVFCTLVGIAVAAGGMAELKSITGDAPYQGAGNAPAMMPQPMGFWGRPRYYGRPGPMDFGDEGPMVGGGVEGMERENLMLGALTVLGNLINPSADAGGAAVARGVPQRSSPIVDNSRVSLAEATGGGFYKGRGNS
ncbi:unnamed protein product, partial [Mesorhabditis spiculigera]